jgi:VWFA-related protein
MNVSARIATCVALLGTAGIAQSPRPLALAAQTAPRPKPSFTAGVDLVRLDVRVTDADGRPVRDLLQNEIEVLEGGERRPVVFFQHLEEPVEPYADAASHTIASEVSTNQGAARGHLYVLFFDQQHIAPGNEQRARQAAQRFLEKHVRTGDRVAAYVLAGPGPQIGFTADAKRVAAELSKVRGIAATQELGTLGAMTVQEAFQITRGNEQILNRVSQRLQSDSGSADTGRTNASVSMGTDSTPFTALVMENARTITNNADAATRRVLAMLSDALRPMRFIEGRKSVILISEGFYGDNVSRELEEVAAAAAQSYSVIYALDLNRRDLDIRVDTPTGGDQYNDILDKLNPIGSLAVETDGMLINDAGQRADQAFEAIAAQSQDYYLVGFTPSDGALKDPGKYRRVTVRATRKGVHVSTRTGFALADPTRRLDRRQAIDRALAAPFPQQDLPVQYTTYVLRGSAAAMQRVIVSLAAELPFVSSRQSRPADLVFVVRSLGDGRVVASGTDVIALPAQPESGGTTGTGTYQVQFELPAGHYMMRAVVREPGGLVGSADRRFVVPALDGPSVVSGDLVLSSTRGQLPVRPTAYTGDGLSGVLALYGRTADQLRDAQVTIDLVPIGEDAPLTSSVAALGDAHASSGGATREARLELPLEGIPAGAYLARARVKVGPDTLAPVVREVEIRGGRRPASADDSAAFAFDPREVVNGAFARDYAAKAGRESSPSAAAALKGLERLGASDYLASIAAFQAALQRDARNAAAAFFLGWAYHGAGDDRQAITAWRGAAYTDPTIVPVHLALADMYVRLSHQALAVQALRAGLTALPHSPELLDRLSRLEQRP